MKSSVHTLAGQGTPWAQDAGQDIPRVQDGGEDIPRVQDADEDIPRALDADEGRGLNQKEEIISKITSDIVKLDGQILNTEKKIEEIHDELRIKGERGNMMKEKDRLVMKEQQLRKEKEQLREEKIILLKRACDDESENDDAYGEWDATFLCFWESLSKRMHGI